MQVQVHVIHAFSIDGRGGNPAGVVFDADPFSTAQKQAIATAAGFPETAFISASAKADFKLDFFTPVKQIPHCGHATIATFSYLKATGRIQKEESSKETIDGIRRIFFEGGQAFMEQQAPVFRPVTEEMNAVLQSLGIKEDDLLPGLLPSIVNTGNSFLVIPLRNEAILAAIQFDRHEVIRISAAYGLIGYYLYTHAPGFDATARMFAPYYGIDEEAATGMAAGPLACYLHEMEEKQQSYFLIEQGRLMRPASPSRIRVRLDINNEHIERLFAGGEAYVSSQSWIDVA